MLSVALILKYKSINFQVHLPPPPQIKIWRGWGSQTTCTIDQNYYSVRAYHPPDSNPCPQALKFNDLTTELTYRIRAFIPRAILIFSCAFVRKKHENSS